MPLLIASLVSTAVIVLIVLVVLAGLAMALTRRGTGIESHPTPQRRSGEQAPGAGKNPSEPSA